MKVSYISDLHLDFHVPHINDSIKWLIRTKEFIDKLIHTDTGEKEVLCIAGDLSHFNNQSIWALESFSNHYEKVYMVLGNHDYYLISGNQSKKYGDHSANRASELVNMVSQTSNSNIHILNGETMWHNDVKFGGCSMWYPLESYEQQTFFYGVSNDSRLIKRFNIKQEYLMDQYRYNSLLEEKADVMISHFPVINIDSHFKYNSTACYLTPVKDIQAKHWVFGHSHEQKVYEKPYCKFYMNALGYPEEKLELSIKSFEV